MGKFILNVFALSPFGKKIFRFTAEKIVEAAPSRCRHFMLSGAVPSNMRETVRKKIQLFSKKEGFHGRQIERKGCSIQKANF
jgi:hypothetical protein